MKITLSAFALAAVLTGAASAQEVRLNGTVAEVFGSQIVLTTPEGRILVTLPEGATPPAAGARLAVEGLRDGQTLRAATIRPQGPRETALADDRDSPPHDRAARGPGRSGPDDAPLMRRNADLPAALTALGLRDVAVHHATAPRGERETFVFGRTADGTWMRARLREGVLDELRGKALSRAAVEAVLPPGLRGTPVLAEFARIDEVAVRPRGEVHLRGSDARGRDIEARFDRTGALDRVERRRDTLRSPTVAEAEARLAALDYREIDILHRGPRHIEAIAINPYGERIEVRMNDLGIVDRERMLTR
jgi:hypothetical protein